MKKNKVTIELSNGETHDFPVIIDKNGEASVDFSSLEEKTGIKIVGDDGNPIQ